MAMNIDDFIEKNRQLILGIIIGLVVFVGGKWVMSKDFNIKGIFHGKKEQKAEEVKATTVQSKIPWYEKNKDLLEKVSNLEKEGNTLHEKGDSNSISKYKEALDLIQYNTAYVSTEDEFNQRYSDKSKEEQKDLIGEFTGFGNRVSSLQYDLAFGYRDAKDAPNNLQNAIDAAKEAIKQKERVVMLDSIEFKLDPDNMFNKLTKSLDDSSLASYYSLLGDLYRNYGAYDLSVDAHTKAVELDPKNANIYVWYGLALVADYKTTFGCQQFKKALVIDPQNADAAKFKKDFCY
jgi:tetratricopeptide (TPR) repeat protein